MGRLGIFGGTFDPPHIAHLALAAEALRQLGLERVLWVLTPDPPHKPRRAITPVETRLELVRAAIRGEPRFELSRVDIDRPPPHYALDTVRRLRETYPGAELVYLMGGDSLRDLPNWRQPQEFVLACHALGVMRRPRTRLNLERLAASLPTLRDKVRFFDTPRLDISASDIRRRVRLGHPYAYMLPAAVGEIIAAQGLYQ